jgi:hypothetical protein
MANLSPIYGHAIAQVVSSRRPTAEAQVWSQARSYGICSEQNGTGVGFLLVFPFILPILIPLTVSRPFIIIIIRGCYSRPTIGQRIKWTHPNPTLRIKEATLVHFSYTVCTCLKEANAL